MFPPVIQKCLAVPAKTATRTIRDVKHIVILMQENRSFDHYFGTLRGVRGFGDRFPVPLASGKDIWFQSDGEKELSPFHLNSASTSALRVPDTPHSFSDAQAAWDQGRLGYWPKYKTAYSMGHYRRPDIPFQFALAEAFTICDAYHCSVTSGTDPNRVVFFSGASADPTLRAKGINCTDADSEPDNLRCWVTGALPDPGYGYRGSALTWPTIPDVLEAAGISWRMYQDPNDNYTGAMHGGLAFQSFRNAKPGSPIYEKGMSRWTLRQFRADVMNGVLPQVSWILPSKLWSEHPSPSSPTQGAEFTSRILAALISNPEVWRQTVFFQTFDENDGQFDHVPPPAVPSFNPDGTLAGKSTVALDGEYFFDPERAHLHPEDNASGSVRPWGLGPRVPMYVVSPWSKGGWVNSQVFDHTSIGQFLEKRFGIHIPGITPWHRAICGDLTSTLDFSQSADRPAPFLPYVSDSDAVIEANNALPKPVAPVILENRFQEPGTRPSRQLPYALNVRPRVLPTGELSLTFVNTGTQGAVFHVYDRNHLDRIPRRYTVEAKRQLGDEWKWKADDERTHDLWIYGPAGFLREVRADLSRGTSASLETDVLYDAGSREVQLTVFNPSTLNAKRCELTIRSNAYRTDRPSQLSLEIGERRTCSWSVNGIGGWYDFTVLAKGYEFRFAGRMEWGDPSTSDPHLSI